MPGYSKSAYVSPTFPPLLSFKVIVSNVTVGNVVVVVVVGTVVVVVVVVLDVVVVVVVVVGG